ncbi:SDR family oxidoreductase [Williamsia sp. CHRR-6]|uniref:SDR family oxidoreductase n=1 Tax=Williamsia sp. CHRR-6 TaxID=2835871 RepID=UPI001BD989E3|nr:SDR family oxidoreductase [Williamsia sp. CHRR-6]MBT0565575.1 SDR family oxidoreductase [Williamsia sp. CHRR-6]
MTTRLPGWVRLRSRPPVPTLADRIVVITGAASGIGRAAAVEAGRLGARLVLTDISTAALSSTVADLEAAGATVALSASGDVSDHGWVVEFARRVHDEVGVADVVMNIAGVSAWGTVENLTHETWRRMVDINLMGPIHIIETFVPAMVARGAGGHLVNVSSAAGLLGLPWHAAYSASKFGIRGVSEVLRFDLARHRIGVSLVCPGAVATPLVGTVDIAGVDRENPRIKAAVRHFENRAVTPEFAAAAIIEGVLRNRYMVYTSRDIRFGFWVSRVCPPLYAFGMRVANDRFAALAKS